MTIRKEEEILKVETILKKELIVNKQILRILGVFTSVVLLSLGAFVRIPLPFTPVPLTLQTLFVLLSSALLGSKLGFTAQVSYIMLGVLGLPVFTGAGSGIVYLFGPTGGYLIGFILAGIFLSRTISYLKQEFVPLFILFCLADAILLLSGTFWIKFSLNLELRKSFIVGFYPFVYADILKAFLATAIYLKLKPRVNNLLN